MEHACMQFSILSAMQYHRRILYVGNQDVLQDTGCFVIGYMPLAGPMYAVGCRMLGVGCWKGLILVISEGGHRTIDYTTIHPSSHR